MTAPAESRKVKRKPITDKMKWQSLLYWGAVTLCPECGLPIRPHHEIEWDHRQALIHGGTHDHTNIRPLHAPCHLQKTARDIQANAKVKRLAKGGRTRKGPKMKSRGFRKDISRKMSGEVVTR